MLVMKDLRVKIAVKKTNPSVINKIYQTLNSEYNGRYRPFKKYLSKKKSMHREILVKS